MEKHTPHFEDTILPDNWKWHESITKDSSFKDSSFPGCQFRVLCKGHNIAINIKVTGKPHFLQYFNDKARYRSRVKIEWVGDGEPSDFSGGWLYHT